MPRVILLLLALFLLYTIPFSQGVDSVYADVRQPSPAEIQKSLKTACSMAQGGAVLYGLGFATQIVGTILVYNESQTVYGRTNGATNENGLIISLAGNAVSLGGCALSCAGGTKAKNVLLDTDSDFREFAGWRYFTIGTIMSVCAPIFSVADVPIAPTLFLIGGEAIKIGAIVHSIRYTRDSLKDFSTRNRISLAPCIIKHGTMGFRLAVTMP